MTADTRTFIPEAGSVAYGARVAGAGVAGEPHDLPDPATGERLARVGWVDPVTADDAARAAYAALPGWSATPARERAAALRAIAADLRANTAALAAVISAESGKRLSEATAEVGFSALYLEWFADAATVPRDEGVVTALRRFTVTRKPVGVVAAVSPWNFPLSIPARKVAPALAAGCTVVQKASELTPLTSLAFTEICERHLPAGAVNVVVGDGEKLTTALVDSDLVAAVTFTGSTAVGASVAARAARTMTRVTMELGGKGPFIVTEHADPDASLEALLVAKFRNNGASCIAANNVFVHESMYDGFVGALRSRIEALVTGAPSDAAVDVGPMLRPAHVERLERLVAEAEAAGCPVSRAPLTPQPSGRGYFVAPTLVEATSEIRLWNEEVFGPVCVVRPYTAEDDIVAEINGWRSGLGGYVMSDDAEHAARLAGRLEIGIVGINNGAPNTPEVPFGGFGYAGMGREGGLSGLYEFTEEQTLSFAR
ncbi:aldehyde dehydrogenase family protein [Phytoactinopolyspora halotolerans]|uniref:Aldehyde dehydrogenase family protein n=1 Tax=Phytoactinopolyspora halotolerans TaxID=1981512 RepID=A0A6L9SDC7_9ACTN|nr:aldehyde dehydrogenase family protein [Phytoactinopolyspora halotolerans]NEE02501.1 aldehyde dehydrogenase family protein [Phytoactinopolyspora halotolerans]